MRTQDVQEPVNNAMLRLVLVLVLMVMVGLAGLAWPPQRRKSHGAKYAP
jgi:hypothetical protein